MNAAFVLPDADITIALIPKSASSSVLTALHTHSLRYSHVDAITTSRAGALWRHPTERAWSAYKYIRRHAVISLEELLRKDLTEPHDEHYYPRHDLPYDEFLHTLAENRDNPHIMGPLCQQSEYCKSGVPYTLVPWDFEKMALLIGVGEIPHKNPGVDSTPMPDITPEMQYHLTLAYEDDYRIWEQIA